MKIILSSNCVPILNSGNKIMILAHNGRSDSNELVGMLRGWAGIHRRLEDDQSPACAFEAYHSMVSYLAVLIRVSSYQIMKIPKSIFSFLKLMKAS